MKTNRQAHLFPPLEVKLANPGALFAEFEQLLVSNSGEDAFDVGVKLLAAKLEDEITSGGDARRFSLAGNPQQALDRVESLLRSASKRWPGVIEFNGGLNLSAEQLARCMRPLVGWDVLGAGASPLDALLERLVSRGAKGALGQYFTPRPVVRMCVEILNPGQGERVIDPACGSAGFLVEAVHHARIERKSGLRCLGIDFGARALKVASLLAATVEDEAIRISDANSIDGRLYAKSPTPSAWNEFIDDSARQDQPWGAWHALRADVVLTNPPFAGDVDDPEILRAYESQREFTGGKRSATGREHLFVERIVSLLAEHGRAAIVLPQGLLANSSAEYLRSWLVKRCKILGVIGLHPFAFLPHTGVKTSILFVSNEKPKGDYGVFFGVSRHPGKDSSGRESGLDDYGTIAEEFGSFLHQQGYAWARHRSSKTTAQFSVVSIGEVLRSGRLDAEYHEPEIRQLSAAIWSAATTTLGAQVARAVPRFKRAKGGEIDYIDISAIDSRSGMPVPASVDSADAPSRAAYEVQPGDILVSTVRPDRNTVALVTQAGANQLVASNGFCVLRPHGVSAEVLFTYCKSTAFRRLLSRHATASMYPAVTDADVLSLPLAVPTGAQATAIEEKVKAAFSKMDEARREMREAIASMDSFLASIGSQ